jgi:hypothetical protein
MHFFFAKKSLEEVHKDLSYACGQVEATLARPEMSAAATPSQALVSHKIKVTRAISLSC